MENETKLRITYELQKLYKTGDRVSNKELKETIQKIYHKCEYLKKATATDIQLFGYEFKRCKVRDMNNNRINGLELVRI